jgi:hypothetical protein
MNANPRDEMSQVTIAALVERVNQLSQAAGLPPISIAEPFPSEVWYDGMSEPDEHGAVRLQYVEETVRPMLQDRLDAINAGITDEDRKLTIADRYFVRQAIETFGDQLSRKQVDTIFLNTGQWALQTSLVGRQYPVEANDKGHAGQRLGNHYLMTFGPSATAAGKEVEKRYIDAIEAAERGGDGGTFTVHG